ncbi:hypothetical protein [Archangium primigenium]|uniref:hypothetical protein n=1 Tax=[Archangium] primigenium TaxID=2792470 RepID=UPI001EF8DD5D|nr:hypothetical protein [Archangium primigenium]
MGFSSGIVEGGLKLGVKLLASKFIRGLGGSGGGALALGSGVFADVLDVPLDELVVELRLELPTESTPMR